MLALVLTLGLFATETTAQEEAGQDVLKVSVEEVRIPVAAYDAGEYRKLDVLARRQGLVVRSRRGYVAKLP